MIGAFVAIYALGDRVPQIHPQAYVHPDATVIDRPSSAIASAFAGPPTVASRFTVCPSIRSSATISFVTPDDTSSGSSPSVCSRGDEYGYGLDLILEGLGNARVTAQEGLSLANPQPGG